MKIIIQTLFLLLFAWACTDEPVETKYFDLDTDRGVFIACEGNFMYGNGSLSFYHTGTKKVTNHLFYARNNAPLGDVVQSLARINQDIFIVVNNSGKVVIADAETMEYKGSITDLVSPRNIHFISERKAYLSDLYANHLTIFDPKTFEKTGEIDLEDHTSEQMVQIGKYVYISDWSYGRHILVVDTETDEMTDEIEVPLQPKNLTVDRNGKIWILSDGGYENSPSGNDVPAISRIDPETRTIEQIYRFKADEIPAGLEINGTGDTLYFLNRDVYKMAVESRRLPDSAFIKSNQKVFYHLAVDSHTNDIYIADAIDYTQDAAVYRYSQAGIVIDTFKTGINPSDFMFR